MTPGNVAIVQRAYEAFSAGDLDGLAGMASEDFVLRSSAAVDGAEHYGPQAMAEVLQVISVRWEHFHFEPLEYYDAGTSVLVLGTLVTKGYGEEGIASTAGQVWTLENGRLTSMKAFLDSEEAIRASGLTRLLT